jgi:hypothetical protein
VGRLYKWWQNSFQCFPLTYLFPIGNLLRMYLPIFSWIVQIVLRIYFIAALVLVCLIGDGCLHLRAKIKLLRGEDVSVASEDCG